MLKGEEREGIVGRVRLYGPNGVAVEREGMWGACNRIALTVV